MTQAQKTLGHAYEVTSQIGWKGRLKSASKLFALNTFLVIFFDSIGAQWLMTNGSSGEANAWIGEEYALIIAALILPLSVAFEEYLFRILPYRLSQRLGYASYWPMGIVSSLLFASTHGLISEAKFTGLPTIQFILGIYVWRYVGTGFKNVFWIHFIYNMLLILMVQAFLIFVQ